MELQFIVGFDPHPLKLLWFFTALIALVYMLRNWLGAIADRDWARKNTRNAALLIRRENVAATNITLFGLLAGVTLCSALAGVTSLFSPRVASPLTISLFSVTLLVTGMNILTALAGVAYRRARSRAASAELAAQIRQATEAQVAREQPVLFPPRDNQQTVVESVQSEADPQLGQTRVRKVETVKADPGQATIELTVDVDVIPPKGDGEDA